MRLSRTTKLVVALAVAGTCLGRPVSAAELPLMTLGCGDEVPRSIRLGADVGYPGGCPLTALRILKDGITLDLNGHTVWGNRANDDAAMSESGVVVGGAREVRVVGGAIRGFEVGLLSSGAERLVVRGVTAVDHSDVGLVVAGRASRAEKNVVTAIGGTGMAVFSDLGVVDGNVVTGTGGHGISMIGVEASVTGNTAASNAENGIDLNGSRSSVRDNVVVSNVGTGIDFTGSGTVRGNRAVSNGGDGIFVFNTDPVRVTGNKAADNSGEGVFVDGNDAAVTGNVASANEHDGIQVNGDDVTLSENRSSANVGSGLETNGMRARLDDNRAIGNRTSGIHIAGGTAKAGGNRLVGNGFGTVDGVGPGIDATGAVISLGAKENIARANDDATCDPAGACADEHTDLPVETHGCGDVITSSFRLAGPIGSMLSRCPGHGLVIEGDGITVDLGGFGIWGSETDGGGAPDVGIWITGEGAKVFGGRVISFEEGVRADEGSVTDVVAQDAQRIGMRSSPGAKLGAVAAVENDDTGFEAGGGLSQGVGHGNLGAGIETGSQGPGSASDSVASDNGTYGVLVLGQEGVVKQTVAVANGEIGIELRGNDSRVTASVAADSGLAGEFRGFSIAGARSIVRSNVSSNSTSLGFGITGRRAAVSKNIATGNDNSGISLGSPASGSEVSNNVVFGGAFSAILANAPALVRANLVMGADGQGIRAGVGEVEIRSNRAVANTLGIEALAGRVAIDGNRASGNGFATVNETGLGIDASAAERASGDNVAYGNDDPAGCDPLSLC